MRKNLIYDRQAISIDCVVFGFDGTSLKVLLVQRRRYPSKNYPSGDYPSAKDYKLPGSLIADNEDLNSAVLRVMEERIGMRNIYMRQMEVFSDPKRIQGDELKWLNEYYDVNVSRVLTVTYMSLVKLDNRMVNFAIKNRAKWEDVNNVKRLALDHGNILMKALDRLYSQFKQEPIAFELLSKKFTIKELKDLYEAILGVEFDNRNFRKKILSSGYIIPTGEKESGVSHKPAMFYTFDKKTYEREAKSKFKMNFGNW